MMMIGDAESTCEQSSVEMATQNSGQMAWKDPKMENFHVVFATVATLFVSFALLLLAAALYNRVMFSKKLGEGKAFHFFFCHGHSGSGRVDEIVHHLQGNEYKCTKSKVQENVTSLEDVKKSECFVLFLSSDVLTSKFVLEEMKYAVNQDMPIFFLHDASFSFDDIKFHPDFEATEFSKNVFPKLLRSVASHPLNGTAQMEETLHKLNDGYFERHSRRFSKLEEQQVPARTTSIPRKVLQSQMTVSIFQV